MFFSRKKKDDKEKPDSGAAPTPAAPTPAAGADLFGGMQPATARRRRKRGDTTVDNDDTRSVAASERPGTEDGGDQTQASFGAAAEKPTGGDGASSAAGEGPAQQKPFFSSFNFAAAAGTVDGTENYTDDDTATAATRARLERFYAVHNPVKLSHIDETITRFKGREDVLFRTLVEKYGPEPGDAAPPPAARTNGGGGSRRGGSNKNGTAPSKATEDDTTPSKTEPTNEVAGFGSTTDGGFGGGGFGDAGAADGGFGGGFGVETNGATTGFSDAGGFGTATSEDGGFGAAGGFGVDDTAAAGGFGFGGDATEPKGAGGFGFGGEAEGDANGASTAAGFGFGAAEVDGSASAVEGGFGFASPPEGQAGGFGFAAADAAAEPDQPSGFGFGETEATPQQPDFNNGGATEAADKKPAYETSDDSSEDGGGRYGALERQAVILADARQTVQTARRTTADTLRRTATLKQERREVVQRYAALETELDRLTANEEYEAAEKVDEDLQKTGAAIDAVDAQLAAAGGSSETEAAESLQVALSALAETYAEQRALLQDTRAEEERRTTSYLAESRARLEQVAERVRTDLERAQRTQDYTKQEVDRVAQRRAKVESKIEEQTKEVRTNRERVAAQASTLEEEIRELERTLAVKRRSLAERRGTLQDLEHQLTLIEENHHDSMERVLAQAAEEDAKLRDATAKVEALTVDRDKNSEATEELERESEVMLRALEEHAVNIQRFERNAACLRQEMRPAVVDLFQRSVQEVAKMRATPAAQCLSVSPHRSDTSCGPIAALQAKINVAESKIKSALDDTNRNEGRLQEIAAQVPGLETAKRAAAQAKQFKEAQAKTAQLKKLGEEKDELTGQLASLGEVVATETAAVHVLKKEKAKEAAAHRAKIRVFTDKYVDVLRRALDVVDAASLQASANLLYLDSLPLSSADPHVPPSDDEDEVIVASRAYIMSHFEELAIVLDCSTDELVKGDFVQPESPSAPQSPVGAGPDTLVAPPVVEAGSSGTGDASPADTAAEVASPYATLSLDELQDRKAQLEADQEAAAEAEEYDRCEEIEEEIGVIAKELATRS